MDEAEIEQLCPGYFWGTETPPPADAATADIVETRVSYGVRIQNSGGWSWCGIGLSDLADAERHAVGYKGTSEPVPGRRQLIEVTRITYARDGRAYAVEERHALISENQYTGSPDPWA